MIKSIAVVVGSYCLSIALVLCCDPLLSRLFPGDFAAGHVPSDTALRTSTALFIVASILSAWVCARFAPSRPALHVLWFFALGEIMGVISTIPNWNKGWPHWYWLSWLLSWPVSCSLGALIGGRRATAAGKA